MPEHLLSIALHAETQPSLAITRLIYEDNFKIQLSNTSLDMILCSCYWQEKRANEVPLRNVQLYSSGTKCHCTD